uniref:Uncharacterized protein n=1 Tax=Arundo donax TaxID=35708 RepID=A0A0A9C666_ARUDO
MDYWGITAVDCSASSI